MRKPFSVGFTLVTHFLVLVLGLVIGFRASSGITFRQLVGLAQNGQFSQIARINNTQVPPSRKDVDFSLFWEVWSRLERDYVAPEKIDAQKMVYGAIAGMTSAVGDPYTVFLPPETKQRLTEDLQGEFDGVGIQLGYVDGQLAVIAPLKDHPAEKAGVKAGDYILRIKDPQKDINKETVGMSSEEAVTLIRGKKGTKIVMTFLTKGAEPREIELTRETIEVPSLEVKYVEKDGKKYAHFVLSRFGEKTIAEWDAAVLEITNRKDVAGLVLDMRGNPGGYLQDAIEIASDFVQGGVVVSQKGRNTTQPYKATRKPKLDKFPTVVLVNKGSASASEIVAGALRDRRQIKLVGEQTFGKGTVQDAQQLSGGAGLNITIARWLLPSGDSIQDSGVPVDVQISDNTETEEDEALAKALEQF